ncbi:MAG: hypothetical protein HYS86_00690 [Candidatus Chisholmbacteria bacterium]|nr:hypothetical protein [Candidatus Chisholmbacteria bacterium]
MQASTRRLNLHIEKQLFWVLHQMLADATDPDEVGLILKDLLGETQHIALAKKLAIVAFLDKGRSYENIKETLKVSSATVATVQEQMGNPGIQAALRKVKAEVWAEKWSHKIANLFKSMVGKG